MENFKLVSLNDNEIILEHTSGIKIEHNLKSNVYYSKNIPKEQVINHCHETSNIIMKITDDLLIEKVKVFGLEISRFVLYRETDPMDSWMMKKIAIPLDSITVHSTIELIYQPISNFNEFGFEIESENIFNELKKASKLKLQELKKYLMKYNTKFILDVYEKKDCERKYKIFYSNEFIEIE